MNLLNQIWLEAYVKSGWIRSFYFSTLIIFALTYLLKIDTVNGLYFCLIVISTLNFTQIFQDDKENGVLEHNIINLGTSSTVLVKLTSFLVSNFLPIIFIKLIIDFDNSISFILISAIIAMITTLTAGLLIKLNTSSNLPLMITFPVILSLIVFAIKGLSVAILGYLLIILPISVFVTSFSLRNNL